MKRGGFLKRYTQIKRTGKLKARGDTDTNDVKDSIQSLVREVALIRDGGCVFREHADEMGACGGYRNDGELVLQFDHLNTRARNVSFSDVRLGVIACKRHHIFFKPQYGHVYERVVREVIGPERCALLDRVRADQKPYRYTLSDWKREESALRSELASLRARL